MRNHKFIINYKKQELVRKKGFNCWEIINEKREILVNKTAIIICDMWDKHWSRGATERVLKMVNPMNNVINSAREQGITIIHSPSDTLDFYKSSPARKRIKKIKKIEPHELVKHNDCPLPIDDSDGGSDTGEEPWFKAWSRQHPEITINQEKDVISDDGQEIYSFIQQQGIEHIFIMGVHTNMCILNRSFGIKQMVRWGVNIALVRDLTDAMYNPAKSPYVSHQKGTELVIQYIEKFWCPTINSSDLSA